MGQERCEGPLGGRRYLLPHGRPYCPPCYQARHAHYCDACGDPIGEHGGHPKSPWRGVPGGAMGSPGDPRGN
uniref:Uncharacterized protein n=1 Tax=Calidris pygmaea TaxID=425635 RepID=A0A8C3PMH4_9CHAR